MNSKKRTQLINTFKHDLWKDVRKLTVCQVGDAITLKRYSDGSVSPKTEMQFISFLESQSINWKIPKVCRYSSNFIEFEYLYGIRIFNLIVELRYLAYIENNKKAIKLFNVIKSVLFTQLKCFTTITKNYSEKIIDIYPAFEKCFVPIELLTGILDIKYRKKEVQSDIKTITAIFTENADCLFRDATPKNALLNIPFLYKGNFSDDFERRQLIRSLLESNYFTETLLYENIYQFDYTGCIYKCPEVDDLITLNLHESMSWSNSSKQFLQKSEWDTAFLASMFVRFMRFGSRKLAYRLIQKDGHKIRFHFDNEIYYFENIIKILENLQSLKVIQGNELIILMKQFIKATFIIPKTNLFETSLDNYYTDLPGQHKINIFFDDKYY